MDNDKEMNKEKDIEKKDNKPLDEREKEQERKQEGDKNKEQKMGEEKKTKTPAAGVAASDSMPGMCLHAVFRSPSRLGTY